jgi:hypothetical protein
VDFKLKAGMQDKWDQWIEMNSKDDYSKGVVTATQAVMKKLAEGADVKDAHDAMYGMGLTGFMAGCLAGAVAEFSERGDEFRKFWNERLGVSEEKAKGGTVNPAIVTIG